MKPFIISGVVVGLAHCLAQPRRAWISLRNSKQIGELNFALSLYFCGEKYRFLVGQASFSSTHARAISQYFMLWNWSLYFQLPKCEAVQCQLVNLLNWRAYRDHCQDKTTTGSPYNESDDAKGTAPSKQVFIATNLFCITVSELMQINLLVVTMFVLTELSLNRTQCIVICASLNRLYDFHVAYFAPFPFNRRSR